MDIATKQGVQLVQGEVFASPPAVIFPKDLIPLLQWEKQYSKRKILKKKKEQVEHGSFPRKL